MTCGMTNERRTGEGALSTGELHSILASPDRRHVLEFFREREEPVATVEDIADYLVERDDGFDDQTEARIVLHHAALPKLSESVAFDYDHRTGVVRYRGPTRLDTLLPDAP